MASDGQIAYEKQKSPSDQAEASTSNRGAGRIDIRVLVELQVIAFLLHQQLNSTEDLVRLRQDIADSIT